MGQCGEANTRFCFFPRLYSFIFSPPAAAPPPYFSSFSSSSRLVSNPVFSSTASLCLLGVGNVFLRPFFITRVGLASSEALEAKGKGVFNFEGKMQFGLKGERDVVKREERNSV